MIPARVGVGNHSHVAEGVAANDAKALRAGHVENIDL